MNSAICIDITDSHSTITCDGVFSTFKYSRYIQYVHCTVLYSMYTISGLLMYYYPMSDGNFGDFSRLDEVGW